MTLPIAWPRSTDKARIAKVTDRYPEALLHKSHVLVRPINISFTKAPPSLLADPAKALSPIRLVRFESGPCKRRTAVGQALAKPAAASRCYAKFIRGSGRP